jgi:hypothetical protein
MIRAHGDRWLPASLKTAATVPLLVIDDRLTIKNPFAS